MQEYFWGWIKRLSRFFLLAIATLAILATNYGTSNLSSQAAEFINTKNITVYRSPSCACCGAWLEHIRKQGFNIQADIKTEDMEAIKQKYNLPQGLASCHTAIIDGYIIEGHVPANDIQNLLQQKPQALGLAVPGMTIGTPGMEMGDQKQPFTVLTFDRAGKVGVFKEYKSY